MFLSFEQFMECGRLRSKMSAYQKKKNEAIKICENALLTHEAPYAALSGGKDSVAMAFIINDAAKKCGKDFRLWAHISDASFPGTEETCVKVSEMTGRQLDISRSDKAFEMLSAKEVSAFGKSGVFFSEVRKYNKTKDVAFVGVRANESKRRMKAAKIHGDVFLSNSMGGITVVNPLQWFDVFDVAAALAEYNAPIHPIYRKVPVETGNNSNGEPLFIRLSYITAKDLWNRGTLVFIRINYPDIYAKMLKYCPEISRFT